MIKECSTHCRCSQGNRKKRGNVEHRQEDNNNVGNKAGCSFANINDPIREIKFRGSKLQNPPPKKKF